jgi:PKD repeat protein
MAAFFRISFVPSCLRAFVPFHHKTKPLFLTITVLMALAFPSCPLHAQWMDTHWPYRRALEVNWDSDHSEGHELAVAQVFTSGHDAGAADIRVADQLGKIVPSHVLSAGPGDCVLLVFALTPGETAYYVYFGNPAPPPPPPGTQDVVYHCGLLLQMKQWQGDRPHSAADIADQWENAGPILGQTFVDQPWYDKDPFGNQPRRIFKLTGVLTARAAENYNFAGSAENFAALFIDGESVLVIPSTSKVARYHATARLSGGTHDFVIYYVRYGSNGQLALDWMVPGSTKYEPMPRNAFGVMGHARVGELEEYGKTLVADFQTQYQGECPVQDGYTHRYVFSALVPANLAADAAAQLKFDWDFGDGVQLGGRNVEHVFLTPGVYPVTLTMRTGGLSDAQTTRLSVQEQLSDTGPPQDSARAQGAVVARYDPTRVTESWLPWMVLLERDAQLSDVEMSAAACMVSLKNHTHRDICLEALNQISDDLVTARRADEAANLWGHVPADSDLQPEAATREAGIDIWWIGDFPAALKAMQRLPDMSDPVARRLYAEALVMNGRAADGQKIFDQLEDQQESAGTHIAAVSGAMARTIEYRIDQKDWQTGEVEWETWQDRCPSAFSEGYSVLLRTELMECRDAAVVAAKVDEAFCTALPNSPYAPALLDRASTLLSKIDPAKSKQLRDLLRDRYPEDPLSQK